VVQIGQRLAALREGRGTSLHALENQAGISLGVLRRIESGSRQVRMDEVMAIAAALQLPVASILDENPVRDRVLVSTAADLSDHKVKAVRDQLVLFLEMDEYLESHGIR
jgi:transcriptional regulator with XRE-family HTH domain